MGTNGTFLYDVGDPLNPRVICRLSTSLVHILTATSFAYLVPFSDGATAVVTPSIGSANEPVNALLQADLFHADQSRPESVAWSVRPEEIAYLKPGGSDANGFAMTDVWLSADASSRSKIYSYSVAGRDAFHRPGFPPPTLGFSADGAYLAAGWSVASSPVHVFRLADKADVTPQLPADFRFALWSKTGDTLYMVTGSGVAQWTPGGPVTPVPGTAAWILSPSWSPDGSQVAYTIVTSTYEVRTYVYDLKGRSSHLLMDQPRSSAIFVKSGWVWHVEEIPCVQSTNHVCFDPTEPSGRIFAVNLATGHESPVTFTAGESPTTAGIRAGDLWPSS